MLLVVVVGCVESNSVRCPQGSSCPAGTACATVADETLCVFPDQLAKCVGKAESEACGANVRCYEGVCLPAGCGNGRVDPDEACDDGNTTSNDGCSPDCLSTEVCGNGVIDLGRGEQCDDGPIGRPLSHDGCASNCTLESAQWFTVGSLAEVADRAAFAYDAARDRLVLFGDFRGTAQTWEWDGGRWMMQSPRVTPMSRLASAMAYDPVRKRVVLFGGGSFNDTWEWDGTNWVLRSPTTSPSPRSRHVMAFDPRRQRVVLFGGLDSAAGFLGDTWAWNGDDWTPIQSSPSPSARMSSAMAYDPQRDEILLFGGLATGNVGNDETWVLSATGWTQRMPATAPPARSAHGLSFDPRSGLMVMHGGSGGGTRTDTWLWNGADWRLHPTAGPPIAQFMQTTVLREGSVIAFDHGKTFRWDAGWTLIEDSTQFVPPRFGGAGAVDLSGRRFIVHGGTEAAATSSTMVWTGAWQRFTNVAVGSSPGRVSDAAMAFDAARREFVHFGGYNVTQNATTNETWVFTSAWTQRTPAAPLPPPRLDHVMVYDAARERTVLFGGAGLDDTWLWDGTRWMMAQPTTKPPPRSLAAAAYDPIRQVTVMFGGLTGSSLLADTWEWNGTDWQRRIGPGPPPRFGSGLAWDAARKRLVLFGGSSSNQALNDQWEWDGTAWTQVPTLNSVKPRASHVMVTAIGEGGVLSFGGSGDAAQSFSDLLWLRWDNSNAVEDRCDGTDADGDGLVSCADADCWHVCKPECPPGSTISSTCGAGTRGCGDGTCDRITESCSTCPIDCTCIARCGDLSCDAGESTSCPGDCP